MDSILLLTKAFATARSVSPASPIPFVCAAIKIWTSGIASSAERVKSIYSDVYGTTFNALAGWPDAPTYEELTLGEDHVRYYTQFTGQLGW